MAWARIDDQFHAHPKVQRAWQSYEPSLGLHLLALSHASAYLTNGEISEPFVRAQIPNTARRRRAVAALVEAGLWEENGAGWMIHDYLDFNESRERVEARRRMDSKRKRGGSKGVGE